MKIGVIKQFTGQHGVRRLCRTLGVTRSAYYTAAKKPARPRARDNARLEVKMGELFEASGRTYGSPRLTVALCRAGERCGRRRVARLMRRTGPRAKQTMPAALVARAFERAVTARQPAPGLLHPSDRGSQYASDAYRELLRRHGAIPSMSRAANCYDNATMESFWATLKTELIDGQVYATRAEAKSARFRYIEVFYNRPRLHGAPGYHSPVDFEHNLN